MEAGAGTKAFHDVFGRDSPTAYKADEEECGWEPGLPGSHLDLAWGSGSNTEVPIPRDLCRPGFVSPGVEPSLEKVPLPDPLTGPLTTADLRRTFVQLCWMSVSLTRL